MAAFIEGDDAAFLDAANRATQAQPIAPIVRALMIAHAAKANDQKLLKTHHDALNGFAPGFIASMPRGGNRQFAKDEHMDMLPGGLRKAGVSE